MGYATLAPVTESDVIGNSVWHTMKWSESTDTSNEWTINSQTDVTCDVAGTYLISSCAYFTGVDSSSNFVAIRIRVTPNGGSTYTAQHSFIPGGNPISARGTGNIACVLRLNIGDSFQIQCWTEGGTQTGDVGLDSAYTYVHMAKCADWDYQKGTIVALNSGTGNWTVPADVSYLNEVIIVGGGGGGGSRNAGAGGGGAGGLIYLTDYEVTPGANLAYSIGAGGAGGDADVVRTGYNGGDTSFDGNTAIGGGGGHGFGTGQGQSGGSGGGGGDSITAGTGTVGQGFDGGIGSDSGSFNICGGGGGGASSPGGDSVTSVGGAGGNGKYFENFTAYGDGGWFAGGGGGSVRASGTRYAAHGGRGGGADGGGLGVTTSAAGNAIDAPANTGGGGAGANSNGSPSRAGAAGGSGVVLIRYGGTDRPKPAGDAQNIVFDTTSGTSSIHCHPIQGGYWVERASWRISSGWAKAVDKVRLRSTGKWYVEFIQRSSRGGDGSSSAVAVGWAPTTSSTSFAQGSSNNANNGGRRLWFADGRTGSGSGSYSDTGLPAWTTGDIIGMAWDADAGTVTGYVNGVSQGVIMTGVTGSRELHHCAYYYNETGGLLFPERAIYKPADHTIWS